MEDHIAIANGTSQTINTGNNVTMIASREYLIIFI